MSSIHKFVRNEELKTVRADWLGTPLDARGRFQNHEFPFRHEFKNLLKWKLGSNPQSREKRLDDSKLEILDPANFLQSKADGILWLGHASFFIRLNGKGILLDPVFGNAPFIRRFADVPSPINILPEISYVLLSHDHRDHADRASIQQIAGRFPQAKLLAGLGMEDILNRWTKSRSIVETAGWYQEFTADDGFKITFVPVRHWARRTIFDLNKRLWGGFVIQSESTSIYFSGDSGYGGHFRELKEIFPQIDYFIVGIGAYSPRFVMQEIHQNPAEAFCGFVESGSRYLIPMHYGTFDLTNEPPSEPLNLLIEAAKRCEKQNDLRILKINESLEF